MTAHGSARAAAPRGLLHVELDYPTEHAEELHDWYNTEHVPERLNIAGFLSGRRYAALESGARWLALYETEQPSVLESPEYLHWLGPGEASWTKRVLSRNLNARRTVCELVWSGAGPRSEPAAAGGPAGLFSLRLSAAPAGAAAALVDTEAGARSLVTCPGVDRAGLYRAVADPSDLLVLCELNGVWAVQRPDFRQRWVRLASLLDEHAIPHARALYVRLL